MSKINYPDRFDPETTFVTLYAMPGGAVISHGSKSAPVPVPEGATELTPEEYDAAYAAWEEARKAHRQAARLAEEEAHAAAQAAALGHFRVLVELMPEATARLVSNYEGPWPVAE